MSGCFLLLSLIYGRILSFFPSFVLKSLVRSSLIRNWRSPSQFQACAVLHHGADITLVIFYGCSSKSRERISCRASQPFCVSSRNALFASSWDFWMSSSTGWYLYPRGFLSQARREKKELVCCAVRNSEVLKRSFPFATPDASFP